MTREQTLAAAEVMRRAAEGEPVEWRNKSEPNRYWRPLAESGRAVWDWYSLDYRIAEPPPHGENAHNPGNLTPTQVQTHLGWRLLDRDEIRCGVWSPEYRLSAWQNEAWNNGNWGGHANSWTYRTKLTREELAEARGIKTPVPWSKPEHVPLKCYLRPNGVTKWCGEVVGFYATGLRMISRRIDEIEWHSIIYFEYSTDRVTWKPCTISE